MPELPEVEALRRQVRPSIRDRRIESVEVLKPRLVRPDTAGTFSETLLGAKIVELGRAGKFLLFRLQSPKRGVFTLTVHLGMTGHLLMAPEVGPIPKHAAVVLGLDKGRLIFDDPRQFGRMTVTAMALPELGPEPLGDTFTAEHLAGALAGSKQAVKVRLLDQSLVAGIGNIYASEALHLAGISPSRVSAEVTKSEVKRLRESIRSVLERAIESNLAAIQAGDSAYYRETAGNAQSSPRFNVYDRDGEPCLRCKTGIVRLVQAGRSSYFCPGCQR
jgi:formamidopyrimidine-DNA glycosylase